MMMFIFAPVFILLIAGLNIIKGVGRSRSRKSAGPNNFYRLGKVQEDGIGDSPARSLDGVLFSLAHRNGGHITLSEVVIETGMNMKDAEKYMDSIVDSVHVSLEVDDSGRLFYVFPEIAANEATGITGNSLT